MCALICAPCMCVHECVQLDTCACISVHTCVHVLVCTWECERAEVCVHT